MKKIEPKNGYDFILIEDDVYEITDKEMSDFNSICQDNRKRIKFIEKIVAKKDSILEVRVRTLY